MLVGGSLRSGVRACGWWMCGLIVLLNGQFAWSQSGSVRFEGLGDHRWPISTQSEVAQQEFNRGVAFLYAFNHDEAIRGFELAASADPECALPYWGVAYALGPNINYPFMEAPKVERAITALEQARERSHTATPVERELIAALATRYQLPAPEDRRPLDVAYAQALRELWRQFPQHPDVGALFAESLMDLWPWDLWSRDGEPRPDTAEVLATLETVLKLNPKHPLALHLYVHALEASPTPEKAAVAADTLRTLQPGLGHMVHMPSHIDVRLGNWQQAIAANERAILADARYRELSPDQDFYRLYMAHNHHMLAFAAMMQGQSERSTQAIQQMLDEMPESWLEKNAPFVDGMFAMPYELHLRFGRWQAMLDEPEPQPRFPITRVLRHYGRGVAYAALKDVESARAEQRLFLQGKATLPAEAMFVQNSATDVLAIAELVLAGEIHYRAGETALALSALREAVRKEDALRYIEPPDWIQPSRHVLGATLMDAGQYAEAEEVFRADLQKHPNNGWSLHDLARSLQQQKKVNEAQAAAAQFQKAWQHADVQLSSACFCLPSQP